MAKRGKPRNLLFELDISDDGKVEIYGTDWEVKVQRSLGNPRRIEVLGSSYIRDGELSVFADRLTGIHRAAPRLANAFSCPKREGEVLAQEIGNGISYDIFVQYHLLNPRSMQKVLRASGLI
tara:strand:- start:864 stop:1229 length:366 start_codon:yes stop_codon:yes gene_type:complete